jgi:hypothetical protein
LVDVVLLLEPVVPFVPPFVEPVVPPMELFVPVLPVEPVEPVVPPIELPVPVVLPGVLLDVEPVPVAPIEAVPLVVPPVPAVVVSVLEVLPVVVLGDVVLEPPLRLPVVLEPGVVLDDDELAPVPLVPVVSLRWHAPSESAATTVSAAAAAWVRVVFIRNSLGKWFMRMGRAAATALCRL